MKWNEMSKLQKVLTVLELVSGLFFWALFLLSSLNVLKAYAACVILLFVHCLCQALTERNKILKIMWAILTTIGFAMAIMLLLKSLNV